MLKGLPMPERDFVTRLDVRLPIRLSAPAAARRALDQLESQLPEPVFQDVLLLANELVTNSVRHGGLGEEDNIGIKVALSDKAVRVEVSDPGPGFDKAPPPPPPDQPSGWGLQLVSRLADKWGNIRNDPSLVWFEIDTTRASG